MADISSLAKFMEDDPINFSELVISCGRFIDAWLGAGGEPSDDVIGGFYSLWAQSLDLNRASERQEVESAYYAWAYPLFIRSRNELREQLGTR